MTGAFAPILLEIRPVAAEAAIRLVFQVVVNLAGEDGTKVAASR
jgi:hypothetical protein